MPVTGILILASLPIPVLAAVYVHARIYSLYRLFRGHLGEIGYYWFFIAFKSPSQFARQFIGGEDIFRSLPGDLAAQLAAARRDTRRADTIVGLWLLIVVIVFGITLGIAHRH